MLTRLSESCKELKKTQTLAVTAMMTALGVVVHTFATIPFNDFLMFKWSFLPVSIVAMLYGPIPATLCGGMIDLFATLLFPKSGGINPAITLCAAATGLIFGLFLYRRDIKITHLLLVEGVNFVLITLLGMTAVLAFMFHAPFWVTLYTRLIKAVLLPVEVLIMYGALQLTRKVRQASKR